VNESATEKTVNWGVVLFRIVLGAIFLVNGMHRLLLFDFQRGVDFLEHVGTRAPTLDGGIVTFTELIAGAALVLGLFSRWAAAALLLDVLIGLWIVDVNAASFLPSGGKFTLVLLAATLAIMLAGSGGLALDDIVACWKQKPTVENLDVAVRLEKPSGKRLARCIVTVRNRYRPASTSSNIKPEVWHGSFPA
jgi:putative oxidoreductase